MQFNMFEAGASKVPPKKPLNPSIGYPSNGDLSNGEAPTQLGAYWIYQFSEEFTSLLKDNGIEPSPDDLHQLSTFFKNYKTALDEIKEVAVEAGSGAKGVLADMRQTHKEMIALKAGTADDLEKTRSDLEDTRNALSEVNTVLDDARTYTQKFNVFQNDLDTHKADVQALINKSADLKNQVGSIVSGVQADKEETKSYRDQAQLAAERAKLVEWKDIKSKPLVYPPSAHNHEVSDIKNLTNALTDFAKHSDLPTWNTLKEKPTEFVPAKHKHPLGDVSGLNDTISSLTQKVDGVGDVVKQSLPKAYITESWRDGDSWYRMWSDGWYEQWGASNTDKDGRIKITLCKPIELNIVTMDVMERYKGQYISTQVKRISNVYAQWRDVVNLSTTVDVYSKTTGTVSKDTDICWHLGGFIIK